MVKAKSMLDPEPYSNRGLFFMSVSDHTTKDQANISSLGGSLGPHRCSRSVQGFRLIGYDILESWPNLSQAAAFWRRVNGPCLGNTIELALVEERMVEPF